MMLQRLTACLVVVVLVLAMTVPAVTAASKSTTNMVTENTASVNCDEDGDGASLTDPVEVTYEGMHGEDDCEEPDSQTQAYGQSVTHAEDQLQEGSEEAAKDLAVNAVECATGAYLASGGWKKRVAGCVATAAG